MSPADISNIAETTGLNLNILIIGAGIAGLAAANTLSQDRARCYRELNRGHGFFSSGPWRGGVRANGAQILEQSENKREAGYMIVMGSNAMRVLVKIGVDDRRAHAVDVDFIERRHYKTLEVLSRLDVARDPKAQPKTYYRPDLHEELKRVALLGTRGKAVKLVLGAKVVQVDIENASVTLADGKKFNGDMLIGADGERSIVKASFSDPGGLRQAPFKIFRSLVPTSTFLSDKRTRKLLALSHDRFLMFCHPTNSTISIFVGQDGNLIDIECGYRCRKGETAADNSDPAQVKKRLLEQFADYHPDIQYALSKAAVVKDWEIWRCTPQRHLSQGNTILTGDAAHSMEPTTGQGGSQGLEDAGALAVFLSNIVSREEIPNRLRLLEKMRVGRTETVVALAGIRPGEEETIRKNYPWHAINRSRIRTGVEHLAFLFDYDVISESKKVLEATETPRASL